MISKGDYGVKGPRVNTLLLAKGTETPRRWVHSLTYFAILVKQRWFSLIKLETKLVLLDMSDTFEAVGGLNL